MSYALVTEGNTQYYTGIAEIEENSDKTLLVKNLDVFCGVDSNNVWKTEFAKSVFERPISFYNVKFDNQTWYGIWISEHERRRLIEMFNHLAAYVRFLELGKLPK